MRNNLKFNKLSIFLKPMRYGVFSNARPSKTDRLVNTLKKALSFLRMRINYEHLTGDKRLTELI